MRAVGVIPARMASTRFPGKPLTPIAGRPMLEHCWRGSARSELLDEVVIATCDEEIAEWSRGAGVRCVMTSDAHERATDRVAEAAESLDAEVIVLIQGDEPMVMPEQIDAAARPVLEGRAGCTNLVKRIADEEELRSPNTVKVVADLDGRALYFSRSAIPSPQLSGFAGIAAYKQVAIFGFDRETLAEFARLEPTPYEKIESVDMLRYVEHGREILLVETDVETHAVDVPADVAVVERLMGPG